MYIRKLYDTFIVPFYVLTDTEMTIAKTAKHPRSHHRTYLPH